MSPNGSQRAVRPHRFRAFTLDRSRMEALIATAPRERSAAARERPLVLSLPAPGGDFRRFAVHESPVMEAGLAAKHPEIRTYAGRGIDDPAATVRFDLTPLGFHASIRGPQGAWYIDPYYQRDESLYVSYYGRDLTGNPVEMQVADESPWAAISLDRGYSHSADTMEVTGSRFAPGVLIRITISGPKGDSTARTLNVFADESGSFAARFVADPDGSPGTHTVEASSGLDTASATYNVVGDDERAVTPPVGDQLRTYRLALLSDPTYAAYFGSENVTAAKVTLINRVTQVFEDETSIRLVLIANNDVLNLNTAAQLTGENGPCGRAPCFADYNVSTCFSYSLLNRNREVTGLLVGASSFDIGHIVMGVGSGGMAGLIGEVGDNYKALGCSGIPWPVGDLFAVNLLAHEMGHQFAANHTWNGVVSSCAAGSRVGAAAWEPGSGSSVMGYAGTCDSDNLQQWADPYWSARSFDEIVAYTSAAETDINEVQMAALTGFGGADSFRLRFNGYDSVPIVRSTNYTATGVRRAIERIPGWPAGGAAVVSAIWDGGFTITFGGTLANTNVSELSLVGCIGCTGYVGEIAKGGATTRRGTLTATGNHFPIVSAPTLFTIPIQTPFALTGSAEDPDGDTLTYTWEQTDRGGATGSALTSNTKTNGPLFRQFGASSTTGWWDVLLYDSPGENHVAAIPTRVFPDLPQILANNTNAETGACPDASTPPTKEQVDCFSEFLPTPAYVGVPDVNANPLALHFRLTARDGHPGGGGVGSASTTLFLAPSAGPFLVTSPNTAASYPANSTQTVTWNVAGTNVAPVGLTMVTISLSVDGGYTYPYVLAEGTPNDGSEAVTFPDVGTTHARVKVEAVGNVFFDVSNSDFVIRAVPVVTSDAPGGGAIVQYSDSLSPTVTVSASDTDSLGSLLAASATGLPAGLSLAVGSTSDDSTLPGTRNWMVTGTANAAPGIYPVTIVVTDEAGGTGSTSFSIVVNKEDAEAIYSGDMLVFTPPSGSSATVMLRAVVRDGAVVPLFDDGEPGDITYATAVFKEGATQLCGPFAVALLDGDTTTGTAGCDVALSIGAHTIDVLVNGYYTGAASGIVEVAQPNGSFVTGGGSLLIGTSDGIYEAEPGSRMNFGFNVKYTSNMKNPQGHTNVIFRAGGRIYQIKSTAIDSLGIALRTSGGSTCSVPPSDSCLGLADFRSKANLTDVTDPLNPLSLGGKFTLRITITDRGEPGSSDSIGATLWDGSTLVFSSEWTGAETREQVPERGNLVVH